LIFTEKEGEEMANIREIAKLAGVSVSTVSRVLNDYPYVKEEKRRAVLEAMDQLNYKKNINAVHLAKGKTCIVGVMLPDVAHPYFSAMMEGVAEEALRFGYHLLLFQTNYDVHKELEALEMLRMKQMDGLIICSHMASIEAIEAYMEDGPIVLCEDVKDNHFLSVSINHYDAFLLGMNYLINKGHTKIGYCIGRPTGINSHIRKAAYEEALRAIDVQPNDEWRFEQCLHITDGKRVVEKLCSLHEKPTALLVTSDQVAAGIILWGKAYGVTIPNDLAIVSFDNHPIAEALGITTIELPLSLMGKKAFHMIYHCLKTGIYSEQKEQLPVQLIERMSG